MLVLALSVPAAWAEPEVVEPEVVELETESNETSAVEVIEDEAVSPSVDPALAEKRGFEVMTVTAEKRSADLQQVPQAITALSGHELFSRGIYDVEALASQVPNFHYGEVFGLSRITIRGIGVQGFNDPSTAFHIDGLYQNNPTAASALTFYDVEQIEVLRGPQGTLWGRNSTAGSINVSTRQPSYDVEVFGDALYGAYNRKFIRSVVNVPVVDGRVATRVAFYLDKRDGYQENLFQTGSQRDADDADMWGIRPQLRVDVSDEVSVTVRGSYNHQGGVGWGSKIVGAYPSIYVVPDTPGSTPRLIIDPYDSIVSPGYGRVRPNPDDPRKVRTNAKQFQDVDTWDVNVGLDWDLYNVPVIGDVTFNVVAGYKEEDRISAFDVDLTEQDMTVANVEASTTDLVLDAHLRSSGDTSTEWLVGFFLLDAKGKLDIGLPGGGGSSLLWSGPSGFVCNPFIPANPCFPALPLAFPVSDVNFPLTGGFIRGENENSSIGSYAHVKLKFFDDQFNVGAGVRYNYDSKTGTRAGGEVNTRILGFDLCVQPAYSTRSTDRWDGVTGDVKMEFRPADDHMVYGSVSRGYKPGAINGDSVGGDCAVAPSPVPNAKDEGIWAFEFGTKNLFFDQVMANLTGFYYMYDDLQVLEQVDQVTVTDNAREARIWGIEFEASWMLPVPIPTADIQLSVVYGYLHARYENYVGFDYATGLPADFSGKTMLRSPEHSGTVSVDYTQLISDFGSLTTRVEYYLSDDIYFSASNRDEDREPSYGLLQIRERWEDPSEQYFVEAYVENVMDKDVRSTRAIGSSLLGRPVTAAYEPPRTWGVRVGGSF
ncbi:MAG: TonB-dependent receptor [Myxococcota bacterium]|nr:TonB-dependent receptor [Myxococcota bacterium]